ncbi:MAG: hypothetical protein EHM55_04040 [Acidobacteria bacterium]|nr:MAG: hypothetical protein EHM55_04040 [Acidobacteriota bacterium]
MTPILSALPPGGMFGVTPDRLRSTLVTISRFALILLGVALGAGAVIWLVFAFWRIRSGVQRRAAGEAPLRSRRAVVWRDPGPAESLDLAAGPGGRDGAPAPPFRFMEEHATGTFPCVSVRDARDRVWRVKWGDEVHTEAFATRLAWAAGYFVEVNYFVPSGRIEGVDALQRAGQCISQDGGFRDARFELDEPEVVKHFDEHSWAWNDNPFVGARELAGLKIMMMLLSNWDNKDVRDVARGSNTAIFEHRMGRDVLEARYLIIDWGAAMGTWGSHALSRGRWNYDAYAAQNDQFVLGMDGDTVLWGYKGQRTADAVTDIRRSDVRWLYKYVGGLSDDQLAAGLRASGGTETEIAHFTRAVRARLDRLKDVAETTVEAPARS